MSSLSTRNYRLSVAYSVALNTPLYWPYMYHYVTQIVGLAPSSFGLLKGIYYLTVVLCEVPFGVLADRVSRRAVLIAGAACHALGCLTYWLGSDFAALAAAEVVFGIGTALASGATSALLYDSLQSDGRANAYPRLEGRVGAAALIGVTLGFPATDAWLVRDGDPLLAYLATFAICAVGAMAAFAMVEPERGPTSKAVSIGRGALSEAFTNRSILRVILYSTGVSILLRAINGLVFDPVMSAAGVRVDLWGTAMAAMGLVGAVCAWRAHAAIDRWGERRVAIALVVAPVSMYLALACAQGPSVIGILCINGLPVGMLSVLVSSRLNRLVSSSQRRATVLSLQSMAERASYGAIGLAIAFLLERASVPIALYGTVALACVPIAAAAWIRPAKSR